MTFTDVSEALHETDCTIANYEYTRSAVSITMGLGSGCMPRP